RPECIHDEQQFLDAMPDSVITTDVEVTELMGAEIYLYIEFEEQNMIARVLLTQKNASEIGSVFIYLISGRLLFLSLYQRCEFC
ncbi:MAG: hypothetical protein IKV58_03000, partial [Oscillospiraceae bacterium]|nr:hypothetical protein [Oscillospiraceae bacterium]